MKSYQHLLEKELLGRKFVFPSPYDGITTGVINSVVPVNDYYDLPSNGVAGQGGKYHKLIINIISTSGIPYNLDEIYVDYGTKESSFEAE